MLGNDPSSNGNAMKFERVNLMLAREDSAWLDQLADEIKARAGLKVSHSAITRAALATLRELHKAGDSFKFGVLADCKSGADLAMLGVIAIRCGLTYATTHVQAAPVDPHIHTTPIAHEGIDSEPAEEIDGDYDDGNLQKGLVLFDRITREWASDAE